MTNEAWLNTLSTEEKAKFIARSCNLCSYDNDNGYCSDSLNVCKNGIKEWLNKEHKEPMPEIKAGDFIYTKTKAYGCLILVCVKEEEEKILFSIDKEKCVSLSAFLHKEIRKICRYDNQKHCMAEIWRAEDE